MTWELKNEGLDRGRFQEDSGEDGIPLQVRLVAGGEQRTSLEVGDMADDQERSMDQRPSAGDQRRRPMTEHQVDNKVDGLEAGGWEAGR